MPTELKIFIFSLMVLDFCGAGLKPVEIVLFFLSFSGGFGALLDKERKLKPLDLDE